MNSKTEERIVWTTVIISVIAMIITIIFKQPSSPIGDCGTDVAFNKAMNICFTVAIDFLLILATVFLSGVAGFLIAKLVDNIQRGIRGIKWRREHRTPSEFSFSIKKPNPMTVNYKRIFKNIVQNVIDLMGRIDIMFCVISLTCYAIAIFFAGTNHSKMCFRNANAAVDFYLIQGIFLLFISAVITLIYAKVFDKIEYRLKKLFNLIEE